MNQRFPQLLTRTLFLYALVLSGCGPGEDRPAPEGSPQTPAPAQPSQSPSSQSAPGESKQVSIEANDAMKFNVTDFSVRPGQRVEVTLKNVGTMPKLSMGHDWVLLKLGADAAAFVEAGFAHAATDYIDPAKKGDVIAATRLLGPGESDTVAFTTPSQPGKYNFVCTFPGHYAVGMKGTMTVE